MATISDIARQAGVSTMTVSKVLRGETKGVRADAVRRAKRIQRIAAELGYRPNAAARQMRSQRFGAAGVVSRKTIGLFHFNMVKGVMRGLAKHNMHLIQAEIDFARATRPADAPRIMRELCVDGIIIDDASDINPQLMDQLTDMAVPAVFVNTSGDHDCVDPDDEQAAVRLAERVLDAGHQRIAYVGWTESESDTGHYSGAARARGCLRQLHEAGLEPLCLPGSRFDSIDRAEQYLVENRDITAWIFDSERHAHCFFIAAQRQRLSIPGDLSIVTFLNTHPSEEDPVYFTAMTNPMIQVGIAVADMLVQKIEEPTNRLPVELIAWDAEPGRTLGPPPDRP